MTRARWAPAGVAVLVAVVAAGAVVASGREDAAPAAPAPSASTAKVQEGELSSMVTLNGILTYRARSDGSPYAAINRASGTYTDLPDAGDRVDCGDLLYRVDDDPVLLLCGTVPAYRDLRVGDAGRDVRQLNRNLHRLGRDRRAGVAVDPADDTFTWRTQAALRRLQRDRGADATGTLDVDDAVVLPMAVRIAEVTARPGGLARPGGQVAQATSDALVVQVDLDASQQGEVWPGDRAQVTLPGNTLVTGRVARLGRVAQAPAGQNAGAGGATIPASISLASPAKARGLDRAPVRVEITTAGVKRALSVPVTALVGRSGGGFAVEVVRAGGRRALVAVQLGLFDTGGGRVQVEGDLRAGDDVVVPAS